MKEQSISRRGNARKEINTLLANADDPFDTSLDLMADIYFFWLRRQGYLKNNDFRNRTLVLGALEYVRASYDLMVNLKRNFNDQGIVSRRTTSKIGNPRIAS